MNQRLTRKEIKRDEFADVVGRGVEYAESHVRNIGLVIGGIVLLAAVSFGIYTFLSYRSTKANDALSQAIKVYAAPIDAAAAKPDDPKEPSFANEAARQKRSKELFEKLRSDYGMSDAADVAGIYLAQIAVSEGQLDRARELWTDFADEHDDHLLSGEVRINLIDLDRQQGKGEELVTRLRGMLEKTEAPLPQDVIHHELGLTLEQLGRGREAIDSYQKILDEFPQSPYRSDAQQRIGTLDPARAATGAVGGLQGFPGA